MHKKRLSVLLDWHCRTQLQADAMTLRALGGDLANSADPVDPATFQAYYSRILALWQEILQQIGPDITAILATASDDQIGELFDNLARQNQEFREKYVDLAPDESARNRQKRMIRRLKYWISDLNPEQRQALWDWNRKLEPVAEQWVQNREMIQAEARRLLDRRDSTPEFRSGMQGLIMHPENMRSAEYQRKIHINTGVTLKFLAQLDQTLTEDQRSHLLGRIESLADDFETLSCDPGTLPKAKFN
jgi:hypothetical protein